ncbi:SRPBCC family protein [Crossiella cryophila]|uniref:Uncharacterized protein YndB with AHSA1/START domain n=1 Tax=Crossiella cryophila TaxID=43355 RepID=A0A7W7FXR3_9PSEU|nr:SRPBCC family protein [Crossiella cryophila]MBB4679224.1 uncharacterized protein YndB with AHSA1/START domain [Crossiella cryophila]
MADKVTGARTEVELTVEVAPEKLWEIITDVARIGEFSPECTGGAWLDSDSPGPRVGARFAGHNEYGDGFSSDVLCVVTESEPGRVFGWVVLDDAEDPALPGTTWRYELSGAAFGRTVVRQTFLHGPGDTGLREMVAGLSPVVAAAGVRERLGQIREHMTETITAMAERG